MVRQIIKEAMNQNPLGLKEAVEVELRNRITLALEAKMDEGFKVGDTVKIKPDASKSTLQGHKDVLRKTGKIVKIYGDGDLKVNFGGNDDRSVSSNDLMKESVDLEEAKMTDAEVLSAAKALAKNGKDPKTKSFGQGLVDFYDKEGSFTPAQVGGLQNIMKNASFQMAKDK